MGLFSTFLRLIASVVLAANPPSSKAPAPSPDPLAQRGTWPIQPHSVVRGFSTPLDPFAAGHRGVDLVGRLGEPITTALDGTVTFAASIAGRGVVVVDHGNTRTTYEPVVADVSVGATVMAGDQIGTLDITQSHCFPDACLHWGWIRGEVYLDPLLLVPVPLGVRLLPLKPADAPDGRRP